MKHIIQSQQFDRKYIENLFQKVDIFKTGDQSEILNTLQGKIIATLFYEPSTRTRLSFESAALKLGASVIGTENALEFSSAAKGETLEDTIRVVGQYADAIVLRHMDIGAAERAASLNVVPIINAGDGAGQHPTQALLDMYTIQNEMGCIDGLEIACVGDLLYGRTVHSLVYLLAKFKPKKLYFIAPEGVKMRGDILQYFKKNSIAYEETDDLNRILPCADVMYQTRIQKERFGDRADMYQRIQGRYVIGCNTLKKMKKKSVILHPLPRVGEILPEVDEDPRAGYFRQAGNGLYVRMALLHLVLNSA